MIEEWRQGLGWEGRYEVSNFGRVRSYCQSSKPKVLTAVYDRAGYAYYFMRRGGRGMSRFAHRLVLEAFVGPCPQGHECGHLDGDPANNHLENLAWVTPKENAAHKELHGTASKGERAGRAKLTTCQVFAIRTALKNYRYGLCSLIARHHDVSPSTILSIKHSRTWTEQTRGPVMTPLAQLRAAKNSLDLFAKIHPIISHDPIFDQAMNHLADAIDRLDAAVASAITVSQERHYV